MAIGEEPWIVSLMTAMVHLQLFHNGVSGGRFNANFYIESVLQALNPRPFFDDVIFSQKMPSKPSSLKKKKKDS